MRKFLSVTAVSMLAGGVWVALASSPVGAAPGQTAHSFTFTLYFGPDLTPTDPTTGSLEPPIGPPLSTGNCPFDANAVFTITGNGVGHGVGNANGFWGGQTIEGAATLTDDMFSGPYGGQATGWQGSGTNVGPSDTGPGQGEIGETFHFHGTNGSQSLDVRVDYHGTMNNKGTITNFSETVTCS